VDGLQQFIQAAWREIVGAWGLFTDWIISVFEPQSGWVPKAVFGGLMLLIVLWVSKRGLKS
jgi:hypothetical protein